MSSTINRKCPECGEDMRWYGALISPGLETGYAENYAWGWWCDDLKCRFRGCIVEPHPDCRPIPMKRGAQ